MNYEQFLNALTLLPVSYISSSYTQQAAHTYLLCLIACPFRLKDDNSYRDSIPPEMIQYLKQHFNYKFINNYINKSTNYKHVFLQPLTITTKMKQKN